MDLNQQTSPATPSVTSSKQSKSGWLLIVVIIILVVILGGAAGYFVIGQRINQPSAVNDLDKYQPRIPLRMDHPFLVDTYTRYTYVASLLGIERQDTKYLLKTNISGYGIPQFLADDKTFVYRLYTDNVRVPGTLKDLQPGQRVRIAVIYDHFRSNWFVYIVTILDGGISPEGAASESARTIPKTGAFDDAVP